MTTSKTKLCEFILFFTICVICFGYIGLFTRYRYIPAIAALIIIIFMFIAHQYPIRKNNKLWGLTLIYITVSMVFFNIGTGYQYIIIFVLGFLILMLCKDYRFYLKLLKLLEIISFVFAISTIVNSFYPNLIINVFGYMLTYTQQVTIITNISHGGYPGLAGEVSFNVFCISVGFCIAATRAILNDEKKALNISKLLLMFYAVILTNKRSLIMILPFVMVCVFIMVSYKGKSNVRKILLIMMMFLIPILHGLYLGDIIEQLLNKGGTTVALSNREWFWKIAYEMIESKPLFGHGINTYDVYYNLYKTKEDYVYFAGAHNSYLQLIAELGYAGGGIYIISILSSLYQTFTTFIKSIRRGSHEEQMLITASIGMQLICIAYAMSENPFYQPQQLFVYFLFVGLAMNVKRQQMKSRKEAFYENTNCKSI
ncbi:O-antigen ligase family protein [Desulforamulus aeronauticus]|uniref:O-antigen ligase n=1 Tax=Desulforamulus aeronauticus DSM 10349 TaxID=1121421 RepID=A0A1M6V3Z3_9FIRM|nr:O-antigen ligase family protein [Desulforamulus aeronauticus]SHK76170.1 O-antigen ligase [Desulforamulus aeronauticus DSM 10349]